MTHSEMTTEEQPVQKEHVSFRLDKSILERLQNEANNQNITLTQLLSDIIRQYLDWYLVASKSGEIPMNKMIISSLVNSIDDEDLVCIAKKVAQKEFKSIILIFKNEFTLDAWLAAFESWLKIAGFPHKYESTNGHHTIIIHFGLGEKFSLFEKELLVAVFELFNVKVDSEVSNDTVVLRYKHP